MEDYDTTSAAMTTITTQLSALRSMGFEDQLAQLMFSVETIIMARVDSTTLSLRWGCFSRLECRTVE